MDSCGYDVAKLSEKLDGANDGSSSSGRHNLCLVRAFNRKISGFLESVYKGMEHTLKRSRQDKSC